MTLKLARERQLAVHLRIAVGRAYRWRTKLGVVTPRPDGKPRPPRQPKQADDLAPKLLKVAVRDRASAATIVIVVEDRFRILVEPGFDPAHLRAVLEVIGQC